MEVIYQVVEKGIVNAKVAVNDVIEIDVKRQEVEKAHLLRPIALLAREGSSVFLS